jgi:hypothetical protein
MLFYKQIRAAFWAAHPQFERLPGRRQNDYNATIRSAFVEFVDQLYRDGQISERAVEGVTL